jgi:hypothetical protein
MQRITFGNEIADGATRYMVVRIGSQGFPCNAGDLVAGAVSEAEPRGVSRAYHESLLDNRLSIPSDYLNALMQIESSLERYRESRRT